MKPRLNILVAYPYVNTKVMDPTALVQVIAPFAIRHTVITGGEPCIQPLQELTTALLQLGTVQIETSGTHPIEVAPDTWVTLSPKISMGGGFAVLPEALARANEIKMPVESLADIENLSSLLDHVAPNALIWLQPVSQGEDATRLCIDTCLVNGWCLSIQTHKYAGAR
jgi:7-carboxy-7-deazaguanine synthase